MCQPTELGSLNQTVSSRRPVVAVCGLAGETSEALGFSFSAVLTECYSFFPKVLVTLPTVRLPSLVPLDPFSPVSPSSHDPRLLLIVTRILSRFSDCSDILRPHEDRHWRIDAPV
ncbi:hypothetical protein GQ457_01G020060 [Hibiscus cannabinus]